MRSVNHFVVLSGSVFLLAIVTLAVTEAPLGSPGFFACAAVMAAAYGVVLARTWRSSNSLPARALVVALVFAALFRIPLSVMPVDSASDMVRYLWDGRVQRLGLNPYAVIPADPALDYTHTDETRVMPSRRARTPYPPAAQLFFRLVSSVWDSTYGMKLALLACDVITIAVVRRWLAVTRRNPWLVLAYAWNPLVVVEVSHSGHIDALGAMWIAISALALTTRRTLLASVAFVLAVATKLLPIVLLPLFWRRLRTRDIVVVMVMVPALLVPFMFGRSLPVGALPGVIQGIRFNGPAFQAIASVAWPQVAAALAVAAGLVIAAWCRWKLSADHPAAWASPMAVALVLAPVVYPWYLLYLTPFLFVRATIPLIVWTLAIVPTYVVWEISRTGGRWIVPGVVVGAEYGALLLAVLMLLLRPSAREDTRTQPSQP